MYKIYVKDTLLILGTYDEVKSKKEQYPNALVGRYTSKPKDLLKYIDLMEKTKKYPQVIIYGENFEQLKTDFLSLYKIVLAAGGLVVNELGEGLFIFKRGAWDLPKGKRDKGEKIEQTAIREIEEETGVKGLALKFKICKTKHTFKTKHGIRAIKKTHWYALRTHKQELTPQEEEDIEKVGWLHIEPFMNKQMPIYDNLLKVLTKFHAKKLTHDFSSNDQFLDF